MSDDERRPLSPHIEVDEGPPQAPEEPLIAPLAPRVVPLEESQVEVSASPAFQVLDELFHAGKLTGTQVANLKAKYTELHDTLRSTRDNELKLLQDAKTYTAELEIQRVELEKADNFPESANTEVSKLRAQLLKHHNDLAQTDEREYQLQYKIENLHEEKRLLEREYSRMPKPGELEKKQKELEKVIEELKKEISQRQQEAKNLREDLDTQQKEITEELKELEIELEQQEKLKSELVQINTLPAQYTKEQEKTNRKKLEVEKNSKELQEKEEELNVAIKGVSEKRNQVEGEKAEVQEELNRQRDALFSRQQEYEMLNKDYEVAKEREAVLLGDRATLDLSLRHTHLEKKTQHDTHSRRQREKDRDLRNLKKVELQTKVVLDGLAHTQSIYEKVKAQVDATPKDDGTLLEKRKQLQNEVDATKRNFAQQNALTSVEQVKVEQLIAEEERLMYEQSDLRIEVVELQRLAAIKADEREQKARDLQRAQLRYQRALEDLKTKQLSITDNQKKHQEMQVKLKDFAKMYDIIKNERNKIVNLIQTSTQRAAEMREKIKILQNEIEILRTAVNNKDRQLQKAKLKHQNSIVVRDSLRNEVAKARRLEEEMREKREQQRMDIAKLNLMINQAEEEMVRLRKRYENAVQNRNDRGVQLIERNEEVCIFYEKLNIQDTLIRNGDVELQGREEEIRFLKMELTELKRSIDILKRQLPNKKELEQGLVTLQIQLSQCQDRMLELEKELENPYNKERVRLLGGRDLPPEDINKKTEDLEMRLSEKEEQLLEKDLIFEQITRLSDRVRKKAESGKTDTLNLAKSVNELQGKIKESTRRMMAKVSELSMIQAEALKLQQDVREKEQTLEQAYIRMEQGEAPTEEAAMEWDKLLRTDTRRQLESQEKRMAEEEAEHYTIAGGITTTAEPRPNAYIPDDDTELPVPRPYGSLAPFKPQEAGSSMRHIRKPIVKPIEI
ncbi:PREDICTED: coiled-coil domain-containing protein 146-like [Branchiostoma belcheri]|uniref:Coiled-coil domain-containing protein 146-like n=1 Tax=Branchiostoma belcheri TaxID=7741 RepID=A0A6P4YQ04_BRABE|nr:PREDICTED: coiled-coil domain-containing protein 146-like [Branchiostoma belcheri]